MEADPTPRTIPVLVRRFAHTPPPLALFRALTDGGRRPHTVLLESADPESRQHRRSLLIPSSALAVTCRGAAVTIEALRPDTAPLLVHLEPFLRLFSPVREGHALRLTAPLPGAAVDDAERLRAPSALDVLRRVAGAFTHPAPDRADAVLLAGLLSYDLAGHFETLPPPRAPGHAVPDFRFYLADRLVVVDHREGTTDVVVPLLSGDDPAALEQGHAAMAEMAAAVEAGGVVNDEPPQGVAPVAGVTVDMDDIAFAAEVRRLKGHVVAGDVFQVVASRTFSIPCPDALAAYERLRHAEPAPYLFYMDAGAFALFGASPESAVRVEGPSRVVEVSPIAGTRPRGLDAEGVVDHDLDVRYEVELRTDPKENAEHLMLVDLARNDVARVSRPGTRRVTRLLAVERYARVMHLVSRVRGELAPGLDALHACQACLNPGTLTGAPKLRAMQLLRESEQDARGHYGGAIGYLTGDGSFDSAIVIRAALVRDGMAHVRAGAGVVHDSDPLAEAAETRHKAAAVLRAIGAAEGAVAHA